jgi:Flp pilus assembly protein TadD
MPKPLFLSMVALAFALNCAPITADAAGTEEAVTDTSASDTTEYDLAKAAVKSEQFVQALPMLVNLVAKEPSNADAWNLLGFTQRKLGAFDLAGVAYDKALAINPNHLGALEYQGELFLQTGRPENAKANLELLKKICGSCEESEDLEKALAEAGV